MPNLTKMKFCDTRAFGYDGILNERIKSSKDLLMPLYIKLFNVIFETGMFPDAWLAGQIRPIYKNNGEQLKPETYRPITILSCLGTFFTSVLSNFLIHDALNENQAGFRKGYGVSDHIFTLNSLSYLLKSQKRNYTVPL